MSVTDTNAAVQTDLQDQDILSFEKSEASKNTEASPSCDYGLTYQRRSIPRSSANRVTVPLLLPVRMVSCTGRVGAEYEEGYIPSKPRIDDTAALDRNSSSSSSKVTDAIAGRQSEGDVSRRANHSASIYPVGSAMQFARNRQWKWSIRMRIRMRRIRTGSWINIESE